MRPRPLRVALTGGIATGKSHCLERFRAAGAPVVDADQLARDAVAPGTPGGDAVLARFGTLDRTALGARVFGDAEARAALEAIIHPRVYEGIEAFFRSLKASAPFGLADIPLLFETRREGSFDRVLLTVCRPEQQLERLRMRGLDPAAAEARVAAQLTAEEKIQRARAAGVPLTIIDTSGSVAETDAAVDRIIDGLASLPPRVCS